MGGVVKAIGGAISGIAKIASPILDIAKMIPGVGQIAGAIDAGLNIAANLSKVFEQGLPEGLITAAKTAVEHFLPAPLATISKFVTSGIDSLKNMVPEGVRSFLPMNFQLPFPKGLDSILGDAA